MMLRHLGLHGKAAVIENALLATLESGIHTADFGAAGSPSSSTDQFTQAIISKLGSEPKQNPCRGSDSSREAPKAAPAAHRILTSPTQSAKIVGIDLFVESVAQPSALAETIAPLLSPRFALTLISNRGTQVWPSGSLFTDCVNQYRVRIEVSNEVAASDREMLGVVLQIAEHVKVCSTEMLMSYNGAPSFSLAQGQ